MSSVFSENGISQRNLWGADWDTQEKLRFFRESIKKSFTFGHTYVMMVGLAMAGTLPRLSFGIHHPYLAHGELIERWITQ